MQQRPRLTRRSNTFSLKDSLMMMTFRKMSRCSRQPCFRAQLLLVAACLLAASASGQNATRGTASIPPDVYAVRACLPFNFLIMPLNQSSPGANGTFTIDGDDSVIGAVRVSVTNRVLAISTQKDFRTNHLIQATLSLDPSTLLYVQNFGVGDVVVGPGFNPPNMTVSATGLGGVYVQNLTTPKLRVSVSGVSTIAVSDSAATDADVEVDGTAKLYLTGNNTGKVNVQLNGITTTFIQGSPGTAISGTADGLAKVLYTDGTCTVTPSFQSMFGINIFGDPCNRVAASTAPTFNPTWTCGLLSRGTSECSSPDASAGQPADTSTVTGPGQTITTSTSSSGPGSSASASGLTTRPGAAPLGLFQRSTGGGAPVVQAINAWPNAQVDVSIPDTASGLAVVGLECADNPQDVPMLQ